MIPIWFKDCDSKWHVFPQFLAEHIETFANGERGIPHINIGHVLYEIDNTHNFWDIFRYDAKLDAYVLRERLP